MVYGAFLMIGRRQRTGEPPPPDPAPIPCPNPGPRRRPAHGKFPRRHRENSNSLFIGTFSHLSQPDDDHTVPLGVRRPGPLVPFIIAPAQRTQIVPVLYLLVCRCSLSSFEKVHRGRKNREGRSQAPSSRAGSLFLTKSWSKSSAHIPENWRTRTCLKSDASYDSCAGCESAAFDPHSDL